MSLFGLSSPILHDEKHADKKIRKYANLDKIQRENYFTDIFRAVFPTLTI